MTTRSGTVNRQSQQPFEALARAADYRLRIEMADARISQALHFNTDPHVEALLLDAVHALRGRP